MSREQTYTFHVEGMHCASCVVLTETELSEQPGVTQVTASLVTTSVKVTGDFNDAAPSVVAVQLSAVLKKHGYSLLEHVPHRTSVRREFLFAAPIAALVIGGFILLQKAGIVNLIAVDSVSYGAAFLIGFVASLSTCMAVVGGLLLSLSAREAQQGASLLPHVAFHASRLVAFFVLGGVIGLIGAAFTLNVIMTAFLSLVIAVVMVVLGINLLDVFPWARRFEVSMPRFFTRHLFKKEGLQSSYAPIMVGALTFLLPCGFTQAMQLYTLSTGSFFVGAMTMVSFALGTFPVLALISWGSFSIGKSAYKNIFFKVAGLVVIAFALLQVMSALVVMGIIPPFLSF